MSMTMNHQRLPYEHCQEEGDVTLKEQMSGDKIPQFQKLLLCC